jgi:hypothetical protein
MNAASQTKKQFSSVTQKLQESAPEPNEALQWLRSTATSYTAFIPGAKSYVDVAFNDLEIVQQKHTGEVEKIVNNAYNELKEASKRGMSMETAMKSWIILEKCINQLGELASDSGGEILGNHPEIKDKVGGNLDTLKQMADSYGPEAKKELDQTYRQIKHVIKGGVSMDTTNKVKQIVQEKTNRIKQLGDETWKKGLEQVKLYLDKNPQIKEILEKNTEALKQGNISELFESVKDAARSGNTDKLQEYVKQAGEQAKNSDMGQSISQFAQIAPGADQIFPKLQKLQEVANEHGEEAEKIVKGAYEDIQEVLQKRIGEAEKLAGKAAKDS